MESEYIDVREFAELIHGNAATVYYLNWSGEGPPRYKPGRKLLYRRSEVMAWIESRRVAEKAAAFAAEKAAPRAVRLAAIKAERSAQTEPAQAG